MTAIADKPWFAPIPMRCAACRADYTGWTVAGCTLDTPPPPTCAP